MVAHDPLRAALEIREQLASEKESLPFSLARGRPWLSEYQELMP